jgi:GT2 family glycosyltransferase
MKITVVIPCYNLYNEFTKNCIKSLLHQELPQDYKLDILVINNCSTDNTSSEVKELTSYNLPIRIIDNPENYGCARAWNQGVEEAFTNNSDYVFIINNDTLFQKQCIVNLVKRLGVNDDVILATAFNLSSPEDIHKEINAPFCEANCASYSAFMIGKRCLEEVGLFEEGFEKSYFEDNDFSYRIKLSGKKEIATTSAMYYHFGSRTQNQINGGVVSSPMFEKNREFFRSKWGGIPGSETYKYPYNDSSKSIKDIIKK